MTSVKSIDLCNLVGRQFEVEHVDVLIVTWVSK